MPSRLRWRAPTRLRCGGCLDCQRPPGSRASRHRWRWPQRCSRTKDTGGSSPIFPRATLRHPSHRPGSVGGQEDLDRRCRHVLQGSPQVNSALELPLELPPLALSPEWKDQQRLWGHAFHPMCSYLASFPAALAHAFIARYSRPGDVVIDPFSGRGTTPLQACAEGRIGVGNDLNPFAHLLTAAKVEPATRAQAATRLAQLRLGWNATSAGWLALGARVVANPGDPDSLVPQAGSGAGSTDGVEAVPVEVALAFHPRTLGQLLFVRSALRLDDRTDRFLAAALTGILHGKSASYLSELMPNTFSMAPRYVRDFAARTAFASPERDVFDGLSKKLDRLFRQTPPSIEGIALLGDARDVAPRARAALRARGRAGTGPAGGHLAAVPAGRQVRLLQLAADLVPRASTRGRSTRRSTTPTIASRTSSSCARCWPGCARSSPTTPSSSSSSATSRPTEAATSAAASTWRRGSGRWPPSPRATGWRASPSTPSPPTER